MAKEPKRLSRMEAVAAINEAIRRQNIARNAALDVKAQRESVSRIRRGPSPSAVDRVLQAVRGFGSVLERAPATRSVGTPGMAPVATGEVGQLASAIGGNGRDDVAGAARSVKRDVQTVGEARRKSAQEAKRKIANAGKRAKQLVRQVAESANRQAESSSSPAPTVPGPAFPQDEAVRLGAELRGGLKDDGRFFANDVGQSAKSQYGRTWELIKDPNQAGRELGEAVATGVRTAAPYVRDTAVGVGTGLKNVATIPYDVGAGLSEGLGFDEEAADSVLEWFGAGRKSAAAKKQAEFADRRRAASAAERQRVADSAAKANLVATQLRNDAQRITNAARETRHELLKGRAQAENARNERMRADLEAQAAESRRQAEQTRVETEGIRARMRGEREGKLAQEGLSAEDIQRRIGAIRQAYGKDISDEQWQAATGFSRDAGAIEAMGRDDRQRYVQALDNLQGRVDRYNRGQAALQRRQQAQAYQRQIMEQRGHWSNGGFQSANRPIFTPNGMTAKQVDFSNRLKAQRMAREMSPTTRGQRAAYGQMVNNGMLTGMNIASFQGMGMQGPQLNRAIGATTGGQSYLNMRDEIAFLRDYMMQEAEMRGRRSAAAMGQVAQNAVTGKSPDDPGTKAAVDNLANGTPPPTPVQAQTTQQRSPGFGVQQQHPQQVLSSGEMADNWKLEHGMTVA